MDEGRMATRGYRFGSFELCEATREVFDRRCAAPLSLQPKMFEVLLYLIEHRARVVMKDELVDAIWGGLVVSRGAVPQCVSMLRKALGDTGRTQQFLKTYYGRGYRFVRSAVPIDFGAVKPPLDVYGSSMTHS
jgi:DNA-binding winged helix-turn-helix (wHTH) protein